MDRLPRFTLARVGCRISVKASVCSHDQGLGDKAESAVFRQDRLKPRRLSFIDVHIHNDDIVFTLASECSRYWCLLAWRNDIVPQHDPHCDHLAGIE